MELKSFTFGKTGRLAMGFDQALQHTKEILSKHGFGVQAEIDISAALKNKLGVDVPRETILGVCNPGLAYKAIQAEPAITTLLPCNVTVKESANETQIATADPRQLIGITGKSELTEIATEADRRLTEALRQL